MLNNCKCGFHYPQKVSRPAVFTVRGERHGRKVVRMSLDIARAARSLRDLANSSYNVQYDKKEMQP